MLAPAPSTPLLPMPKSASLSVIAPISVSLSSISVPDQGTLALRGRVGPEIVRPSRVEAGPMEVAMEDMLSLWARLRA